MNCTATGCDTTTGDGITICHEHTERLEYDLAETTSVLADLGAVAARRTAYGEQVGGSVRMAPLPVDVDALDKGRHYMATLVSWAMNIRDETGHQLPALSPGDLTAWLLCRANHIRTRDWAPVMAQEIREQLTACRRASDKAAQRVFAGMCPTDIDGQVCNSPVYALPGNPDAQCRTCGNVWDVAEWRVRAILAAGMTHGTITELSRALSDPVTRATLPTATIRTWVHKQRLVPIGTNHRGKPVYQLRKVVNLWMRGQASKHTTRTATAAA